MERGCMDQQSISSVRFSPVKTGTWNFFQNTWGCRNIGSNIIKARQASRMSAKPSLCTAPWIKAVTNFQGLGAPPGNGVCSHQRWTSMPDLRTVPAPGMTPEAVRQRHTGNDA
eukprot:scaffold155885_cov16-Tisochrysis_lutea.AAC.1